MRPHGTGSGAVIKPRWYSHGLPRLAYYRVARAVRAHPTQWFNFFDVWAPPIAAA